VLGINPVVIVLVDVCRSSRYSKSWNNYEMNATLSCINKTVTTINRCEPFLRLSRSCRPSMGVDHTVDRGDMSLHF